MGLTEQQIIEILSKYDRWWVASKKVQIASELLALQGDDNELYYVSKDSDSQDETDKIIKDLSGEKIPNIKTITSTDYSQEKEHSGLTNTEIVNKALIYYESDEGDKIGAFIKGFKEALKQ